MPAADRLRLPSRSKLMEQNRKIAVQNAYALKSFKPQVTIISRGAETVLAVINKILVSSQYCWQQSDVVVYNLLSLLTVS